MNIMEFVYARDGEAMTDTLRVAQHFDKEHRSVLRSFDRLDCSQEFRERNFVQTFREVPGPNGAVRHERIVRMTKDGFIFMVMGFTGKPAAFVKEAYIAAFNTMADELGNVRLNFHRQMLALEAKDAESFQWASWGSKKMLERKKQRPQIQGEYDRLMKEAQPNLFTH